MHQFLNASMHISQFINFSMHQCIFLSAYIFQCINAFSMHQFLNASMHKLDLVKSLYEQTSNTHSWATDPPCASQEAKHLLFTLIPKWMYQTLSVRIRQRAQREPDQQRTGKKGNKLIHTLVIHPSVTWMLAPAPAFGVHADGCRGKIRHLILRYCMRERSVKGRRNHFILQNKQSDGLFYFETAVIW